MLSFIECDTRWCFPSSLVHYLHIRFTFVPVHDKKGCKLSLTPGEPRVWVQVNEASQAQQSRGIWGCGRYLCTQWTSDFSWMEQNEKKGMAECAWEGMTFWLGLRAADDSYTRKKHTWSTKQPQTKQICSSFSTVVKQSIQQLGGYILNGRRFQCKKLYFFLIIHLIWEHLRGEAIWLIFLCH